MGSDLKMTLGMCVPYFMLLSQSTQKNPGTRVFLNGAVTYSETSSREADFLGCQHVLTQNVLYSEGSL